MTEAELLRLIQRANPAQRAELVALAAEVERRRLAMPLAYATLWHRDPPRTSQRAAVQAMLTPGIRRGFLLGGNRAGKSRAGAQLAVALAHGRDHPAVQLWGRRNRIDISGIQRGPGRIAVGSLSLSDARRYLRPALSEVLPPDARLRQWDAEAEGEVRLSNGGVIVSKSTDQGRRSWQGDSFNAVILDEESPLDVVREAEMRTVDRAGRVIHTMTPLSGWTALLDAYVRSVAPGTRVAWIHGEDNPHIPADVLAEMLAAYGPHERAARARGEIVAMEGRVYDGFRRDLHVIPGFTPPVEWPRFVGWDFGTRNPTAILWIAWDPNDDVIHVYREHYQADWSVTQHATHYLATAAQDVPPQWIVSDTDAGVRRMLSEHGIYTKATKKADKGQDRMMRLGISAIADRLTPDANGRVHLVIHDACPNVVREIESYTWAPKKDAGALESPRKVNDHAMDALRYVVQLGVTSRWWRGPTSMGRQNERDDPQGEGDPDE